MRADVHKETWLAWLGATAMAGITMTFILVTFVYANFETKEHAKSTSEGVEKRLERMENKIDMIIENRPYRGPAHKGE